MPGFRTHTVINFAALAGLSAYGLWDGRVAAEQAGAFSASFAVATLFLSPDLDLKHSSPTRNWGPLRWLWRPYQWCFTHRGLSHSLLFSSLSRIGYLLALAVLLLAVLARQGVPLPPDLLGEAMAHRLALAAAAVGIFASDVTHIVADRTWSALKILVRL